MDYMVAHKLSQIYDYTVDFFRLQQGDKFKIIYEERFIDDTLYVGWVKLRLLISNIKITRFMLLIM